MFDLFGNDNSSSAQSGFTFPASLTEKYRPRGAAKKRTYAKMARIVDGSDGRTYIAEFSIYGTIGIMRGDMKFMHESFSTSDPRYAEILAIFA
jgi:hypothetical protein